MDNIKLPPLPEPPPVIYSAVNEDPALDDALTDYIEAYARAAFAPMVARAEKAEAELSALKEAVREVVRQMDTDERGKPYVYTQPSMVIWTDKWRGWVGKLAALVKKQP